LGLRGELRGKLSPEDWKPLLASALVYRIKLRRRHLLGILFYVVPSLLISTILSWFWFAQVFPLIPGPSHCYGRGCGYELILPPLVLSLISFLILSTITQPYVRRLRFLADQIASEQLGIGHDLLRVLRKIESFSIPEGSRWWKLIIRKVSLASRIQNLSSNTGLS
jgi:hypothetical protein